MKLLEIDTSKSDRDVYNVRVDGLTIKYVYWHKFNFWQTEHPHVGAPTPCPLAEVPDCVKARHFQNDKEQVV